MNKLLKTFGIIFIIFILLFLYLLIPYFFSWANKGKLIYSLKIPHKNYSYDLYYYGEENATLSTYYFLQKTYNFCGYYKNIERYKSYKYFKSMKLISYDTIQIVLSKYSSFSALDTFKISIKDTE